jgi:pimeloyl-ACP methyl ester carboxylesterase
MAKINVNGITLDYEISGSGDPLVLVAGISYDRWMWGWMVHGLAEHFQVIAFDNRGVGGSDAPPGPYSAGMMAADTASLIHVLGFEKAHVLGHSMGGFIAQALALEHPGCVDRLVLSATNFGGPRHVPVTPAAMAVLGDISGNPAERFQRGLKVSCAGGFAEAHPEITQEWMDYRLANPIQPAAYSAQLAVGLGLLSEATCFEHRLKDIKAPTLILFGEQDQVVPTANATLLQQQIPGSRVKILPGAGHFFPIEIPEAAVAAVVEFLSEA